MTARITHAELRPLLPIVFSFISPRTAARLARACRAFQSAAEHRIYASPDLTSGFGSPFPRFLLLLAVLPRLPQRLKNVVQELDMRLVMEDMYTSMPESWLRIICENCPRLERLLFSEPAFLSDQCVAHARGVRIDGMRELVASTVEDLSSRGLAELLALMPSLAVLRFQRCRGMSDALLRRQTINWASLRVIDVSGCRGISAAGFASLASAMNGHKTHVAELDVSDTKISDQGLISLVHACCVSLKCLAVSGCRSVSMSGLVHALAIGGLALARLDISRCPWLPAAFLYSLPLYLLSLTISHSMLLQDPVKAFNGLVQGPPHTLRVVEVKEDAITTSWWMDLCRTCGSDQAQIKGGLRRVVLAQDSWTTIPAFSGYHIRGDVLGQWPSNGVDCFGVRIRLVAAKSGGLS